MDKVDDWAQGKGDGKGENHGGWCRLRDRMEW